MIQRAPQTKTASSEYEHEAKNEKKEEDAKRTQDCSPESTDAQVVEGESLPKSLQPGVSEGLKQRKVDRKSLKRYGSSGRTRTYNPSVNSRMLYQLSY